MNAVFPKIIHFSKNGTEATGFLSSIQNETLIPFAIERIYWIYQTPDGEERGNHAHLRDEQVILCVSGRADVELIDNQNKRQHHVLDAADRGLYVPKKYWKNIKLSNDAILICISSTKFDQNDYIKDFDVFLKS
jgi:dTDP-4-dehydrorhamnose 3,5-epimerase-like enzyme